MREAFQWRVLICRRYWKLPESQRQVAVAEARIESGVASQPCGRFRSAINFLNCRPEIKSPTSNWHHCRLAFANVTVWRSKVTGQIARESNPNDSLSSYTVNVQNGRISKVLNSNPQSSKFDKFKLYLSTCSREIESKPSPFPSLKSIIYQSLINHFEY